MFLLEFFGFIKEEVLAPPPENDDVVNDFDIEEEVIEVENRLDIFFPCLPMKVEAHIYKFCTSKYLFVWV